MKTGRLTSPAFTLVELIIVMVIITTALAMAAPSLTGWNRGSRLRDAGDQFLALTRWARGQAIAGARVHRLNVDAPTGRYWVTAQEGLEFIPIASDFGQEFVVPEGATITMTDTESRPLEFIEFFPTGRTSPRLVRLADDRGQIDIVCETPAQGFRILKRGEVIE